LPESRKSQVRWNESDWRSASTRSKSDFPIPCGPLRSSGEQPARKPISSAESAASNDSVGTYSR
jgi:hypothetical protein